MALSAILFDKKKNAPFGRLHVGYRGSDWTKVWYQPAPEAEVDEDGTVEIGLFKLSGGGPTPREPMAGEVVWLPHFNPKIFKSEKNSEKERLQAQMLYDAWRYLNDPDPNQILQLEQELDNRFNRQWQSWFEDAKKWKANKTRRRGKRRTTRTAIASQSTGIDIDEIEVNSDTSDDSAYEKTSQMGPPPQTTTTKRKAGGNGGGPPAKKSPNKPKSSPGDKANPRSRGSDQDFPMSGGLGGSGGPRRHLGGSSLFGGVSFGSQTGIPAVDDDGEGDDDDASVGSRNWDNRSPELPDRSAGRNGSSSKTSSSAQRAAQASFRDRFRQQPAAGAAEEEARARQHNGDIGEDEGLRIALRASQQPEDRPSSNQNNVQNGMNGTGENGAGENEA